MEFNKNLYFLQTSNWSRSIKMVKLTSLKEVQCWQNWEFQCLKFLKVPEELIFISFQPSKHPDKLCGPKIFSVLLYFWLDLCLVPSVQKNAATVKSRFVNIWWIHNVGVKFLLWEIFWWNSRYLTLSKYFIAFHSYIHRCHFFNEFLNYLEWMINLYVIILAYLWNSQFKKYSVVWL